MRSGSSVAGFLSVFAGFALALGSSASVRAAEECLECHGSVDNVGEERLVVDETKWAATVHGAAGASCADCHTGKADYPHATDDPRAACTNCHSDAEEALAASVHHKADPAGAKRPDCLSCHGTLHAMAPVSDEASMVHPKRLAQTCGKCHSNPELGAQAGVKLVQPLAAYEASVHAGGVARGEHAATCSDCHGSHGILPADDARSQVNRKNVPATCAACHAEVAKAYGESVHGVAVAKGIGESPVCTDCHGEHRILGPGDQGSPVYASNVPKMTCGRCHGDLRVTEKFGMKNTAVEAFDDSFHGLAGRSGDIKVANCASCHGVHDILPSTDARSHIHPDRIAATCGSCHPGAGASFAIGAVHVLPGSKEESHPSVYWTRIIYLWLIGLTIGGMLLHNGLDFYRKAKGARFLRSLPVLDDAPARMSGWFRISHGLLATSFIVLVYSGFALKYPEAWWSRLATFGNPLVDLRGGIHRIAAVIMLGVGVMHVVHLFLSRRARACIGAMVRPGMADIHELKEKVAYLAGRHPEPPETPWVGYPEKMEYLAVVWGTFVMGATGFILWFPDAVLRVAPKWVTDLATVIHLYEAILAALAILVWHFYLVIFDPMVYPLDTAAIDGRQTPGRAWERRNAKVPGTEGDKKA